MLHPLISFNLLPLWIASSPKLIFCQKPPITIFALADATHKKSSALYACATAAMPPPHTFPHHSDLFQLHPSHFPNLPFVSTSIFTFFVPSRRRLISHAPSIPLLISRRPHKSHSSPTCTLSSSISSSAGSARTLMKPGLPIIPSSSLVICSSSIPRSSVLFHCSLRPPRVRRCSYLVCCCGLGRIVV
jgi:hypothetical protein